MGTGGVANDKRMASMGAALICWYRRCSPHGNGYDTIRRWHCGPDLDWSCVSIAQGECYANNDYRRSWFFGIALVRPLLG